MLKRKDVMDKEISIATNRKFLSVDSYVRETGVRRFGGLSGGRIELKAAAILFGANFYLFADPIRSTPMRFKPHGVVTRDEAFVLYGDGKYVRPVVAFDGERFQHRDESRNVNVLPLRVGNVQYLFTVEKLKSFSSELCRKAIAENPLYVELNVHNIGLLNRFLRGMGDEVDLNVHLFNFANRYQAYSLSEFMISEFRNVSELDVLAHFVELVDDNGKRYMGELLEHFEEVCHASVDFDLARNTSSSNQEVKEILRRVLKFKADYVASTNSVSVKLSNGEHAFRDVFPQTVLCLNTTDKSVKYFAGPKPGGQRWIDFPLNSRILEALECAEPRQLVFHKEGGAVVAYVYAEPKDGRHQLGEIRNVFDHTDHLDYHLIPKSKKQLISPQIAVSDKDVVVFVDKSSHQVFDVTNNKWLDINDDNLIVSRGGDFDRCVFGVGDAKQRVLLPRDDDSKSERRPLVAWFEDIAFQYTIARHRKELHVVKRLADSEDIGTSNPEMHVHYEIPAMRGRYDNRVYAVIDTEYLNSRITLSQTAKFGYAALVDFVASNLSPLDVPRLMAVLAIPLNLFSEAMVSGDRDHVAAVKSIFDDWYVLVRSVAKTSTAPLNLLAWGLNELKRYELVKMLLPGGLTQNEKWEHLANVVGDSYAKPNETESESSD